MKYFSTNHQSPEVDFKQATINGQAPDKGLYFPERIPTISKELIENITQYSNEEIAYQVMKPYVCLLYTSPSPRDRTRSRMPSSA